MHNLCHLKDIALNDFEKNKSELKKEMIKSTFVFTFTTLYSPQLGNLSILEITAIKYTQYARSFTLHMDIEAARLLPISIYISNMQQH